MYVCTFYIRSHFGFPLAAPSALLDDPAAPLAGYAST